MTENEVVIQTGTLGGPVNEETFQFGPWTITVEKSHILHSKCSSPAVCPGTKDDSEQATSDEQLCLFCRYEKEMQFPRLPDMTFARNLLRLWHADGFGLEFSCKDALKCINNKREPEKVAIADAWQEAREGCIQSNIVKSFDWTFSTDYKGTLLDGEKPFKVSPTNERIDIEKLKVKEHILFYDDIHLFEDELADNGVAQCTVKIRIMKGSFFILLRYFLRVDNHMVKMNDTRIYHEEGNNYMLREYTSRESKAADLDLPPAIMTDPVALSQHLPLTGFVYEKMEFPS